MHTYVRACARGLVLELLSFGFSCAASSLAFFSFFFTYKLTNVDTGGERPYSHYASRDTLFFSSSVFTLSRKIGTICLLRRNVWYNSLISFHNVIHIFLFTGMHPFSVASHVTSSTCLYLTILPSPLARPHAMPCPVMSYHKLSLIPADHPSPNVYTAGPKL